MTINGKTKEVQNGSISIINDKIFINGKEINTDDTDLKNDFGVINIIINGNVEKVECNGSVEVKGNVSKGIDCGGSVKINGDHTGSIDAGGSVSVK